MTTPRTNEEIAKELSKHLHGEEHAETIYVIKESLDSKDLAYSNLKAVADGMEEALRFFYKSDGVNFLELAEGNGLDLKETHRKWSKGKEILQSYQEFKEKHE